MSDKVGKERGGDMSCIHYENSECKNGFPVTTGCWATGTLEKNTMKYVKCADENWCGSMYFNSGGKPLSGKRKEEI